MIIYICIQIVYEYRLYNLLHLHTMLHNVSYVYMSNTLCPTNNSEIVVSKFRSVRHVFAVCVRH
jgi:hypothetical protein